MLGKGNVGKALGKGLTAAGHEVKYAHRDPNENVRVASEFGEVIFFAVPHGASPNVAREIGSLADGKVIIDVTNPLGPRGSAVPCTTSAAEEIQKLLPRAKVVKCFNYVFAKNMVDGRVGGEPIAAFVAGDDEKAKGVAIKLAYDLGFEAIDVGALSNARYLEGMAMLIIEMGYGKGMGPDIGYRLIKKR